MTTAYDADDAQQPLLRAVDDQQPLSSRPASHAEEDDERSPLHDDGYDEEAARPHVVEGPSRAQQIYTNLQSRCGDFLQSTYQHYLVLTLVALDLLSIFGDLFISLYACEQLGNKPAESLQRWQEGLATAGLVFSCMFMLELLLNLWVSGTSYFRTWFHWVDSAVIIIAFMVEVVLRGVVEEVASLIVVLRLWRFVKIVEELSLGAEEQMEGLEHRIEELEVENAALKRQLQASKARTDEDERE